MKTWPHSVHSLSAASSFITVWLVSSNTGLPDMEWISLRAATELATTMGLASEIMSLRLSKNPLSSTSSGEMS